MSFDHTTRRARTLTAWGICVVLALVAAALMFYTLKEEKRISSVTSSVVRRVAVTGEMQALSQQVAKAAQLALQGRRESFDELHTVRDRFDLLLNILSKGGDLEGQALPAATGGEQAQISSLAETWDDMKTDITLIVNHEKALTSLSVASANRSAAMLELAELIVALRVPSSSDQNVSKALANIVGNLAPLTQAKSASTRLAARSAIVFSKAGDLGKEFVQVESNIRMPLKMNIIVLLMLVIVAGINLWRWWRVED